MPVLPPPITPRTARAWELWQLVGGQLREYRTVQKRKAVDAEGRETGPAEEKTSVKRVLDLTPLLLLLLLPPAARRLVEDVMTIHRGLGGEKVTATLPEWMQARELEDPRWVERLAYELGVVGAVDPDESEPFEGARE